MPTLPRPDGPSEQGLSTIPCNGSPGLSDSSSQANIYDRSSFDPAVVHNAMGVIILSAPGYDIHYPSLLHM